MSIRTLLVAAAAATALPAAGATTAPSHQIVAPTPPMGWNSWDAFGTTLTEQQAKAQADAMARWLLPSGWDIFTVDIQWYEPNAQGHRYKEGAKLTMDEHSRLLPALEKFPSAANGVGFKPLADYVHGKGLKFGIHIMRGIPRQAVRQNTPILGTDARAGDIGNPRDTCAWNPDMFGVDMTKPGAQAYYDSLFAMYAAWGVDLVKVDDIARPYTDAQQLEIEAIRKAIDKTGRPIVLSLSPGDTPIERGEHVMNHANMWRISDDFWDRWEPLHGMFERLNKWTTYRRPGAWPDADMLPFGVIELGRPTRFTRDEQRTCMTLWCIARSPLILGADLTKLDPFTLELLTNKDVLAVNQRGENPRQVSRDGDLIVWTSDAPGGDQYVALFNAQGGDYPYDLSKAVARSKLLRGAAGADEARVTARIAGAKRLVLVVTDGGDRINFDHAAWVEPTLVGPKGSIKLTDMKWASAKASWGQPRVNRTCEDRPLELDGKPLEGIGTHAISVIEYELPDGYETFTARGTLLPASDGKGSVEFVVLTDPVSASGTRDVAVDLKSIGIDGKASVRDLWSGQELGDVSGAFARPIPPHGCGLFRLSPR